MNLKAINTYTYDKTADKTKNTGVSGTETLSLFTFKNEVENTSSTTNDVSENYTSEMASMFSLMISNVNTQPSDFSTATNKKDLSDIVKENEHKLFGQNSKQMFSGFIDKTDKNIKENEEKLKNKDLTPDEEKRIKLELILYKSEKNLFVSLSK